MLHSFTASGEARGATAGMGGRRGCSFGEAGMWKKEIECIQKKLPPLTSLDSPFRGVTAVCHPEVADATWTYLADAPAVVKDHGRHTKGPLLSSDHTGSDAPSHLRWCVWALSGPCRCYRRCRRRPCRLRLCSRAPLRPEDFVSLFFCSLLLCKCGIGRRLPLRPTTGGVHVAIVAVRGA